MKSPNPTKIADALRPANNGMHGGMEIALTVLVFVLLGLAIDSWLNTEPLFVIVLFVFAALASGSRLWFAYNVEMERLEQQHRAAETRRRAAQPQNKARNDVCNDVRGKVTEPS